MIHWKWRRKNLQVVQEAEDPTDQIVERILDELKNEDDPEQQLKEQIRLYKKRFRMKAALIGGTVAALLIGTFLFVNLQTYTSARTIETYSISATSTNQYEEFAGGVLKYSRDGIAYLDQQGEEKWNQPYQIKTPVIDVNEQAAAVADRGGNDILIFDEEGLKGEVHTTLPIEKICVSEQGIVCAILSDDDSPRILCYDTAGNILVEHKTSVKGTGYPLDVALSPDGEVMQVLYLYTQDSKIMSKLCYYNFGEAGEEETDHQVTYQEYDGTVMASGFFMSQSVSAAVGDNVLTIYKGKSVPKENVTIEIDKEIKSVFHNTKYIGLVLKNEGKEGYELRLYNIYGKMAMSKDFTGDYNNVKLCGSQVIMYDGKKCSIFTRGGIQKFEGEMNSNILEIFPIFGVNKYIVMNENGMEEVRLVK